MSVNLRSLEALQHFRAALIVFVEDASLAVQTMLMELQRSFEWVEREQPYYWNRHLKIAYDQVAQTRSSLETCKMRTVAGQRASCIEEKQAFARAKQRLQVCQDQMKAIKQWANKVHHDADEFRGRLSGLQTLLEAELPQGIAHLEKAITTLESYAEIARPTPEEN